jgi:flagellar biogenesis protein FliO
VTTLAFLCFFFSAAVLSYGQTTNVTAVDPVLPGVSFSLFRLFGALALVVALFLGGVWLFRNWQRLVIHKGKSPKLNIIEVKSLGPRHAIYVVGYEQQRLMIASSPAGVSLITHLPPSEPEDAATAPPTFSEALHQVLTRKS